MIKQIQGTVIIINCVPTGYADHQGDSPEELRHFKQVLYHSATFPAQADLELKILLP
jgi:hypothetical protein